MTDTFTVKRVDDMAIIVYDADVHQHTGKLIYTALELDQYEIPHIHKQLVERLNNSSYFTARSVKHTENKAYYVQTFTNQSIVVIEIVSCVLIDLFEQLIDKLLNDIKSSPVKVERNKQLVESIGKLSEASTTLQSNL